MDNDLQFYIKHIFSFSLIILVTQLAVSCSDSQKNMDSATDHEAPEITEPELAVHMDYIQTYSQKLGLSINGENLELTEFYLHELEERLQSVISEVPEYEGHNIAELTETILVPLLEPIDKQAEAGNWPNAYRRYDDLINGCNICHEATDHAYIGVTVNPEKNPFNQIFERQNR